MEWIWTFIVLFITAYFSQDRSEEAKEKDQLDIDAKFHDLGGKKR
jgi:hypothetical protein